MELTKRLSTRDHRDMITKSRISDLPSAWNETHARIERGLLALPMPFRVTVLGFVEGMVDATESFRNHLREGIEKGNGEYLTGYAAALLQQHG